MMFSEAAYNLVTLLENVAHIHPATVTLHGPHQMSLLFMLQ